MAPPALVDLLDAHRTAQARLGSLPRSIEKRQMAVHALGRWLAPRSVLNAKREDVERFIDSRRTRAGQPICGRTRRAYLSHFGAFYRWATDEGLCKADPTAKIIRPKVRRSLPRPAAAADLARAIAEAGPRERCWLTLAAYEGLRCQEIAGLAREDVREMEGLLMVVHGKGAAERMLPLHPAVQEALELLPMPRRGWVFTRVRGGPYTPAALSAEFNAWLREHRIGCTAHQLRHWFGTELYNATHDLRLTQEMLGHASPATTSVYTAFDRRAANEAVKALDASPKASPKAKRRRAGP